LILRGELEHVPATIFVGLACGGVSELVRTVAISPGAAVGVAIGMYCCSPGHFRDTNTSLKC